ncbi:MAG: GH36-type glycosyl hydrolase domain-containing protein, partial [Chloroflexota bacterium]
DSDYLASLEEASDRLVEKIQRHCWKGDFFARVLFNKYDDGRYSYLGAQGDGLSADPSLPGSYFLNSFTWSILARVATEEQIATMLDVVKRVLLTPHGLKLCSPVNFSDIAGRGGSAEYFLGDRENGGVFKHADAMAIAAMFQAARRVQDPKLAAELADLAYRVLEVILPYRTMADPYRLCGNPRFCTQYNNSETGENIGPTLSGTATWLWLALVEAFGLRVGPEEIEVNPLLSDSQQRLRILLRTGRSNYDISISKPTGVRRTTDSQPRLILDGRPVEGIRVPHYDDDETHRLEVIFS